MPEIQNVDFLIALCLMLGAILYTSVGHAGSSVYIAIMSLFGVPAQVIKPTRSCVKHNRFVLHQHSIHISKAFRPEVVYPTCCRCNSDGIPWWLD